MTDKFYVYELIDPRSGVTFYVGKGIGQRCRAHEREAKAGKQSRKCDIIREIWADQKEVEVRIVRRFKTDIEAYAYEAERIREIGRENLSNCRDGGVGGRVKFGAAILMDEAKELLWSLREWARLGSAKSVSLGGYGRLDLVPIINGYQDRLSQIAKSVGWAALIEEGSRIGLTVRVDHD